MACLGSGNTYDDGCPSGQMFDYATMNGCTPCAASTSVPVAGQNNNRPNADTVIKYGNAGADIFSKVWGAITGKYPNTGGGYYADPNQEVQESGMKYVWYIMGAIILIVLCTFLWRLLSKK